jgi:hypothetical protein
LCSVVYEGHRDLNYIQSRVVEEGLTRERIMDSGGRFRVRVKGRLPNGLCRYKAFVSIPNENRALEREVPFQP